MGNRVVFVQGSPRKKGNTRAAAKVAIESAKEYGAEVAEIDVTTLEFKAPGCIMKTIWDFWKTNGATPQICWGANLYPVFSPTLRRKRVL